MPNAQILVFEYTAGDTAPQLLLAFSDSNTGNPINLTGYAATLKIKRPDGTLATLAATVYDAPNGKAAFIWQGTELVAGLGQPGEIVLTDAQAHRRTYQHLLFNVLADLAGP